MDNNTLSIYHNGFIGKAGLVKKDDTVSEIVQNEAGVMRVIQYDDKSSVALDASSQLEKLFSEEHYQNLEGGLLEGLGKLLGEKTKVYVYPNKSYLGSLTGKHLRTVYVHCH